MPKYRNHLRCVNGNIFQLGPDIPSIERKWTVTLIIVIDKREIYVRVAGDQDDECFCDITQGLHVYVRRSEQCPDYGAALFVRTSASTMPLISPKVIVFSFTRRGQPCTASIFTASLNGVPFSGG